MGSKDYLITSGVNPQPRSISQYRSKCGFKSNSFLTEPLRQYESSDTELADKRGNGNNVILRVYADDNAEVKIVSETGSILGTSTFATFYITSKIVAFGLQAGKYLVAVKQPNSNGAGFFGSGLFINGKCVGGSDASQWRVTDTAPAVGWNTNITFNDASWSISSRCSGAMTRLFDMCPSSVGLLSISSSCLATGTVYYRFKFTISPVLSTITSSSATAQTTTESSRSMTSTLTHSSETQNADTPLGRTLGNEMVYIWTAVAVFSVGSVIFISSLLFKSARKSNPSRGVRSTVYIGQLVSAPTTTNPSNHAPATAYSERTDKATITEVTVVPTVHELSIPGFLERLWGTDYRQGQMIARGGNGILCTCIPLSRSFTNYTGNQPLLVKIFNPESLGKMPECEKLAFWQELSIMWKLRDQSGFCKVFGYSLNPAAVIIKFYACGDLTRFIRGCSQANGYFVYSKVRLIDLSRQICTAIAYMHANGLAHCDIKAQNILLDLEPRSRRGSPFELVAIISDFGISHIISINAVKKIQHFIPSNLNGVSVGSSGPEVLLRFRTRVDENDPRIWIAGDVYALAANLYHLLTRHEPWALIK